MQFMLAIYENDAVYAGGDEGRAWRDIVAAHRAFSDELTKAGVMRGGAGLERAFAATTVRTAAGAASVHDGPYAETKEQLGGFYLIEVDSLDEALDWAKRLPLAGDGAVEVRPCLGPQD